MIKKYLTRRSSFGRMIETIQVEKESEKSVWIDGRRCAKRSGFDNYFDSFDEAKEFLTEYADNRLDIARRNLQLAQSFAGNVKGLKER